MIGAWEISNAAKDKLCAVAFKAEAVAGGLKLDFDPPCPAFPSLKDVAVWAMGPNDNVRLIDGKGVVVLDFAEVESGMYEAERKGEGLFFLRSQAAIRATTVTPENVFGDWTLLQEIDKPLCKITLSKETAGEDIYKIVVKPGCVPVVAGIGFSTWRLEANELMLVGRTGTWRFSESDASTWERIPPSHRSDGADAPVRVAGSATARAPRRRWPRPPPSAARAAARGWRRGSPRR